MLVVVVFFLAIYFVCLLGEQMLSVIHTICCTTLKTLNELQRVAHTFIRHVCACVCVHFPFVA